MIGVFSAVQVVRKYGRRDAVVARLEREVASHLEETGRLVEEALRDLIELGKQSEPGREREWVLEALRSLADRTCSHPSYSGDRL